MILTNIDNTCQNSFYEEEVRYCIKYLKDNDLKSYEKGVYDLEHGIKLNILEYSTCEESEGKWETHFKNIDVQVMIEGEEKAFYSNKSIMTEIEKDLSRDVAFYTGEEIFSMIFKEKNILVFYPEDAHKTAVAIDKPKLVKKAVFKIPL
ncbi:MAG: hypothetical protein PWP46_2093 [Fusobacteriaceae bacterium]|jgi:YhcH/YjgK/YiaL family protein|nr:hypothetical protein [Fusobacteriaceae bacterium]